MDVTTPDETPETVDTPTAARRSAAATAVAVARGAVGGFALGVLARAWMRLISDDPEFTWGGTLAIVIGFTWFGTWTAVAATLVRSRRRWSRVVARTLGVLATVPLFAAAGGVMLPTVAFGTWLAARPPRHWLLRVPIIALAAIPVVFVSKEIVGGFGMSWRTIVGIAGLLAIYGVIVVTARRGFTTTPWRRHAPGDDGGVGGGAGSTLSSHVPGPSGAPGTG